jgi:DNA-binding transcriptional ArsR family regulator
LDVEPVLDIKAIKALSSETRLEILKALKERNKTVSELSKELGLSKSTVHEHLTVLAEVGLVERAEQYTNKWVYYTLTRRARSMFKEEQNRFVVLLPAIFLFLLASLQLYWFFTIYTAQYEEVLYYPAEVGQSVKEEKAFGVQKRSMPEEADAGQPTRAYEPEQQPTSPTPIPGTAVASRCMFPVPPGAMLFFAAALFSIAVLLLLNYVRISRR